MKITLIELNLWYSMKIHKSALTPISDFFFPSKVAAMQQIDSTAYNFRVANAGLHCIFLSILFSVYFIFCLYFI